MWFHELENCFAKNREKFTGLKFISIFKLPFDQNTTGLISSMKISINNLLPVLRSSTKLTPFSFLVEFSIIYFCANVDGKHHSVDTILLPFSSCAPCLSRVFHVYFCALLRHVPFPRNYCSLSLLPGNFALVSIRALFKIHIQCCLFLLVIWNFDSFLESIVLSSKLTSG